MLRLDFDPKSRFEIPVDRVGDLALAKIRQTLEQELKSSQHVVVVKSGIRSGMPYGLVELKRGTNPDEVYEGNYLNMEKAALRMGGNASLLRDVTVYHTFIQTPTFKHTR